MRKIIIAANILAALALGACNHNAEQKKEENTEAMAAPASETVNVKVSELATDKDHVCGGAEGMALADGAIADTASYDGKLYGFCSKECKAEFVKNPTAYIAQK